MPGNRRVSKPNKHLVLILNLGATYPEVSVYKKEFEREENSVGTFFYLLALRKGF